MNTTTTTMIQIIVLGIFLSGCGLVLTELMLMLQMMLSARVYAFAVSFILCWLMLENIVLASDAAAKEHVITTKNNTEENDLLERLTSANKRFNVLSIRLDEEIAEHVATAARLDIIQDKSLSALHWRLLASKAIALYHIERIQRQEKKRRFVRRLSTSATM
jgi:hypothetical protein